MLQNLGKYLSGFRTNNGERVFRVDLIMRRKFLCPIGMLCGALIRTQIRAGDKSLRDCGNGAVSVKAADVINERQY